jgi:hypothetical protein
MAKEEALYLSIGQAMKGAEESQINGKAFVCFFQNEMVFKLKGDIHAEAIALKGAQLFDPSGKGRAMKEWVQVPFTHKAKWEDYAKEAMKYVKAGK